MKLFFQFLTGFVLPVTVAMIIMMGVSIGVLFENVPLWTKDVEVHLYTEEQRNLAIRASALGQQTAEVMGHFENDVNLFSDYAHKLFNDEFDISSYYNPRNAVYSGSSVENYEYSLVFNKNNPTDSANAGTSPYGVESGVLDNVFRVLWQSNPSYAALYMGFESMLMRQYPWSDITSWITNEYDLCVRTNEPFTGYDPTCRPWYGLGKSDPTQVLFTDPYVDATTFETLITVVQGIVSDVDGFIGVVGVDVSMDTLTTTILSNTILENGYSFLVNVATNVIVYPGLPRDRVYQLDEMEDFDVNNFAETQMWTDITSETEGQQQLDKDGETWLYTYAPVGVGGYMIVMAVPLTDITAASDDIREDANNVLVAVLVPMILVTIAMVALLYFASRSASEIVTKPMGTFSHVGEEIAQDNLDVEVKSVESHSKELSEMKEYFGYIIQAIRFGNQRYYHNDMEKAYANYCQVEELLLKIENKKGLGVLWNNKGNVLQNMPSIKDHLAVALQNLQRAIDNAQELSTESKENAVKAHYKKTLAGRYMNLGSYFVNVGQQDNANECYNTSMMLHNELDNIVGIVSVHGARSKMYEKLSDFKSAFESLGTAYSAASKAYEEKPDDRDVIVALQYACLNYGAYHFNLVLGPDAQESKANPGFSDDALLARNYFVQILNTSPLIRHAILAPTVSYLNQIFAAQGNQQAVAKLDKALKDLSPPPSAKNVVFILDVSGSMSGGRIRQCRESILNIIDEHLNPIDRVSLLKFNSEFSWVFQDIMATNENMSRLRSDVNNKTKAERMTKFFDSVSEGMDKILKYQSGDNWIIALTDGEDNKSTTYRGGNGIVNRILSHRNDISMVFITVGQLSDKTMNIVKQMSEAPKTGFHEHVASGGSAGIKEVFQKVAALVNASSNVAMETL